MFIKFNALQIHFCILIFLSLTTLSAQEIPKPEEVFGFQLGADYEMANYDQMMAYYDKLDASDRFKRIEIGESVDGNPMYLFFISSPENLEQLDKWKSISQKMARAKINEDEALKLADEGKAIVWIDGGMHANETAHGQMTPELAYKVLTDESEEMKHIRENVIFLLMPMMNPDGVDIISKWYKRNLGTPYETSPSPWLWQRYVGHDNNRDWFMANLPETQNVMKMLYEEWIPQIVYNQHQDGSTWKRMFVPPFKGPVNQNIHPGIVGSVNEVGSSIMRRFSLEDMPGIISHVGYSFWWNGGGRTVPFFHNQIGILTEMSHNSPTPSYYDPEKRPKYVNGLLADSTSVFYPDPWLGGESHLRDAVEYMLTSSMAVLRYGADRKSDLLYGIYKMGRNAIEKGEEGGPFAYIVSEEQWDKGEAENLINALHRGGIEIEQATQNFTVEGKKYKKGTYILLAAQAFRPYLKDLLEKQVHPDRRLYPDGPPETPYDITGWTLPMQMGVSVKRVKESFKLPKTEKITELVSPNKNKVNGRSSYGFVISSKSNTSFKALNNLFDDGADIYRVTKGTKDIEEGAFMVRGVEAGSLEDLNLDVQGLTKEPDVEKVALKKPKVATYMSWMANMDEGWTRFLLEEHDFAVDTLHNEAVKKDDLTQYDALIIPSQSVKGIMHGYSERQMPEGFRGGLGSEGTHKLIEFVESGGTLITFDQASDYVIEQFGLPVKNAVKNLNQDNFFIPGSLIRANVDSSHPLAYGMQDTVATMFSRSRAFKLDGDKPGRSISGEEVHYQKDVELPEADVDVVVRYSEDDLLMSGWALGENKLAGKPAMVRVPKGDGQIIMFAFRPQFRAQPRGTYKLIFNSIINSTQKD